jgi:peptide/nickel transport system substrate-binding protein
MKKLFFACKLSIAAAVMASCGGGSGESTVQKSSVPHDPNEVYVHSLSDPDMIQPFNYQAADAGYLCKRLFTTLTYLDFKTLKLVPYLAENNAEIVSNPDGSVDYTFIIRKEAKWDDGTPITAKDAEFSMKVMMCPLVNNEHNKPYFEKFNKIILYPDNPNKITMHLKESYIQGESTAGDFFIIPQKVYDPENILADFTYEQISAGRETLKKDEKIKRFTENFNSEKYKREKEFIVGAGPYQFDRWETNQRVVIKKKANWWGDALAGTNTAFDCYAPTMVYEVIKDMTTAVTALKGQKLDAMYGIKPKDFMEIKESESVKTNFTLHQPNALAYAYFGLNTRNQKFTDKKVRQAIAHLVDVDKMIKTLYYDMAVRVNADGIPYADSAAYNFDIKPWEYNIELSKKMLDEAGWKDSDGDGFLDKVINGKNTKFVIEYTYNAGNDIRQNAGMIFKENARQVGIDVNVTPQEWAIYIKNQQDHNFEMCYGAWIKTPVNKDPKQIWHTDSYNGGSNYVGFGNPESDKLIEEIRRTVDVAKYNVLSKQLQAMQHEECAYIFLFAPKERIALHNRFDNTYTTVMRPGFNEAAFKLKGSAVEASAK